MTISATSVKELRDKTGAGMMDCKAALTETGGDMEAAIDWLRAKGLAKAAKKAGRVAAEGLIGVASGGNEAVIVEVNSETDFVARNPQFQELVKSVAGVALATSGDTEAVKAAAFPGGDRTAEREIQEAVATIGEHITLRRSEKLSVPDGVVASYVHNQVAPNLGKIGVLVALASSGDKAKLNQLGRQLAMHVAATSPLSLNIADLDAEVVARERSVFAEQARESGKPEAIIEKMVDGRMRKFYEETVLLAQKFTMNTDLTVEAAIKAAEADVGAPITLAAYRMFKLGDGIEKAETDFAAEVAAAAGTRH
ncbi:MAG: elongation factor Ts [Bauldia sp.]|nr:elongation factor Ts [Bauldia sp.]